MKRLILRLLSYIRHWLANDKERWTRIYKTGTMKQIGWHRWTAAELEEQEQHIAILRKYLQKETA